MKSFNAKSRRTASCSGPELACFGCYLAPPSLLWITTSELPGISELNGLNIHEGLKQSPPAENCSEEKRHEAAPTAQCRHKLELPRRWGQARRATPGRPGPAPDPRRARRARRAVSPAPSPPRSSLSVGGHSPRALGLPPPPTPVRTSGPRVPGPTARHSARAHAWPSPGRCGRSR